MQENKPILVVGLGNPGERYERTRHNVGFMAVRHFVPADAAWRREFDALTHSTNIDGRRVIFALPQTYMNNSGIAVGAIMRWYQIPIDNLIVLHDDMDLRTGTVREKVGGSSAGHNGIRSIDSAVGREYRRIRIGIGHPRDFDLRIDPADWVLGRFTDAEMTAITTAISQIQLIP